MAGVVVASAIGAIGFPLLSMNTAYGVS